MGIEAESQGEYKIAITRDLDLVFDIVLASSEKLAEDKFTHWIDYYDRETVGKKVETGTVRLVTYDSKPAGVFALTSEIPRDYLIEPIISTEAFDYSQSAYYFSMFTVHPDFRNRGIAKIVLHDIEELAKENGVRFIRFDARKEYSKLIQLYTSQGFIIKGEFNEGEGENYYLFEKEII